MLYLSCPEGQQREAHTLQVGESLNKNTSMPQPGRLLARTPTKTFLDPWHNSAVEAVGFCHTQQLVSNWQPNTESPRIPEDLAKMGSCVLITLDMHNTPASLPAHPSPLRAALLVPA